MSCQLGRREKCSEARETGRLAIMRMRSRPTACQVNRQKPSGAREEAIMQVSPGCTECKSVLTLQHKHSLSHNFFSFLDPTQTNPALASNKSPTSPLSPRTAQRPMNTPHKVPMLLPAPDITSSPTLSPLPPSKNTAQTQMLGSFAALEFLIGAGLWVEGQMSGWRCLAGLGYLVVFDAMGVGVQLIGKREVWSNIRRPYG